MLFRSEGDESPDWRLTGDHTVELRAERCGNGNGRVYTITVISHDFEGNASMASVNVTVSKDKKSDKDKGKDKDKDDKKDKDKKESKEEHKESKEKDNKKH